MEYSFDKDFIEKIHRASESIEKNTKRGKFKYAYSNEQAEFIPIDQWLIENMELFNGENDAQQ